MGIARKNRRHYFNSVVKKAKTPEEYLKALRESPHKVHREQAEFLARQYRHMFTKEIDIENT